MAKTKLSKADYVTLGYGQVEPNHLSAQRNGQVYAQLPAAANIDVLENGQFVKYDYRNGVCNFTGAGEWMLVFNEVKVYNDYEGDADFAMIKANYNARVYSPVDGSAISKISPVDYSAEVGTPNPYVADSTATPMSVTAYASPKLMPADTKMVPRVFKTMVGDIFTTNCVMGDPALGAILTPNAQGILAEGEGDMQWQVVKVYDLADTQKAVKLMRIA